MLPGVATSTGGNDVCCGMGATIGERGNVILFKALHLPSTIDTAITVGHFDFLPLGCGEIIDRSGCFHRTMAFVCSLDNFWMRLSIEVDPCFVFRD